MIVVRTLLATSGLVLADLRALVALRPDPSALVDDLAAPHAWVTDVGADQAAGTLAGAALWCAAVWLALGLLAAGATRLPGSAGQIAHLTARTLLPGAVYRVVAGAVGLGVLLAPVAAGARDVAASPTGAGHHHAPPSAAWMPPPTQTPTPPPAPAPSMPTDARSAVPAPTWPTDPSTSVPAPIWPTDAVPAIPAPTLPQTVRPTAVSTAVTVRPGDSLWDIAAQRLGPDAAPARIAAAWPRWYAANRDVIGTDPNMIHPGQHLDAPASTPVQP